MFICTFRYKPEHVRCCLCTEYDPKTGCTAQGCPWLAERIEAGVVGYFAIRLVNLLAGKGKFGAFAYYCWAAGAISLAASLAGL